MFPIGNKDGQAQTSARKLRRRTPQVPAAVNLILFELHETSVPLGRSDPRARHLLDVLHRSEGGTFDAGLINGPRGRGRIEKISPHALALSFTWGEPPPPPDPIILLI